MLAMVMMIMMMVVGGGVKDSYDDEYFNTRTRSAPKTEESGSPQTHIVLSKSSSFSIQHFKSTH